MEKTTTVGFSNLVIGALALAGPGVHSTHAQSSTDRSPGVTVEYIAHACFRIHSPGGHSVLIDPYASRVWLGYDFPDTLDTEAVLITHPHYDHDAGQFRGRPFPWSDRVRVFDEPGRYRVGDISIHGVAGKHADPYGKEFGQINTIWVVEVAGVRIVHLGDNGPMAPQNARELGRVDVLMMPIDADYHILSESEIRDIRNALAPRVLIPMHYRLPDLETTPDRPEDLGPIDPWLTGRTNVTRLDTHRMEFRRDDLSEPPRIVVFDHSPAVTRR